MPRSKRGATNDCISRLSRRWDVEVILEGGVGIGTLDWERHSEDLMELGSDKSKSFEDEVEWSGYFLSASHNL